MGAGRAGRRERAWARWPSSGRRRRRARAAPGRRRRAGARRSAALRADPGGGRARAGRGAPPRRAGGGRPAAWRPPTRRRPAPRLRVPLRDRCGPKGAILRAPMDPRREATARVGGRYDVRVLEPSPPAPRPARRTSTTPSARGERGRRPADRLAGEPPATSSGTTSPDARPRARGVVRGALAGALPRAWAAARRRSPPRATRCTASPST